MTTTPNPTAERLREMVANLVPLDLIHDRERPGQPQDAFEAADRIISVLRAHDLLSEPKQRGAKSGRLISMAREPLIEDHAAAAGKFRTLSVLLADALEAAEAAIARVRAYIESDPSISIAPGSPGAIILDALAPVTEEGDGHGV